jgi:pimeloyl-ACP methyl ester carboxylesterase
VFVGHSVGGLYARAFAAEYFDEVAGMVFVDATTAGQFDQIPRLARGQKVPGDDTACGVDPCLDRRAAFRGSPGLLYGL